MKGFSILIVDDEPRIRTELSEYLENLGFSVYVADCPSAALVCVQSNPVDIAIVDIKLPEYSGLTLIEKMRSAHPEVETVVMSGHGDMDSVIEAFRLGAFDYLRKPFSVLEMQTAISRTSRFIKAQKGLQEYSRLCSDLNRELAGGAPILGSSRGIALVREKIAVAARNSASPVLVQGESGTGKELVARQIHAQSERSSARFVAVNCAAVPRDMFESEFFGHRRGAFTDARDERSGLFRTATGGTLFLDEVSEIPIDLQAKLLRVLESGSVRPVGADTEEPVDVRVVCATNRNLREAVDTGKFRADLYYRLAVIEITVPPLRERPEDIPVLARHFLGGFDGGAAKIEGLLPDTLLQSMAPYSFPGNVRELKNFIERIVIHSRVPGAPAITRLSELCPVLDNPCCLPVASDGSLAETLNLDELEKKAVAAALERTGGVQTAAAALLGISRQALDRRLARYGLHL